MSSESKKDKLEKNILAILRAYWCDDYYGKDDAASALIALYELAYEDLL